MSIEIGIGILALLWAVSLIGLIRAQRRQRRELQALQERLAGRESDLGALQGDLAALTRASVGAGEHLMQVEHRVRRLSERQNQTEMRAGGDRPYQQAIQLVQGGADAEALIRQCGLTRGEADLVVMLHGVAHAG
ncbi:MAG: sporulation initiation inhibitor protein soj [Gammaproteobacteria bacterium]|nr:sporulation initiation inhibitor protein soj [Gammaproteobacteria bacterium]